MISIMTRASFNNNLSCWFIKAYRVKENKKKKAAGYKFKRLKINTVTKKNYERKKKKDLCCIAHSFFPGPRFIKKKKGWV